jgi:ABC-type lipoprotein release transport system permease subunit
MISQTILTNSSYQQHSLEKFLAEQNSTAFQFGLSGDNPNTQDPNYIRNQISGIEKIVKLELEDSSMNFDYLVTNIFTEINPILAPPFTQEDGSRYLETEHLTMYVWNDDIASVLNSLPAFSETLNQNSSLLILNDWISPQQAPSLFNDTISLLVGESYRDPDDATPYYSVNQTVDRRWIPTESDMHKIYSENYWRKARIIENSYIVPETIYFEILQEMKTLSDTHGFDYKSWNSVEYDVYITVPDLTTTSIDQIIFELDQIVNSLRSSLLSQSTIQDLWLYSPLAESLDQYQFEREAFGVALIMISLPLIGVSLFLVYFSLTLVEKRKSKVIAIMKIRGSSKEQLRLMQFAEILVTGTIALIAGMILSIPWALITFRVSDFFEFKADAIDLVIPASWYWRLPLIAIILTINLNINSLLTLSDTRIDEGEDVEESKPPFWQRLYLDLILFTLSVGVLVFVRTFPISDQILLDFLLFSISPWALMITLITSPLVVSRYFSTVISFISDFLWKVQGGMLALATRNMRKNRFSSSRLTALLMLGMMLSFVSIIIPTSLVAYELELTNYNVGADVYISNLDISNRTLLDLTEVEGVKSRTEFARAGINLYSGDVFGYRGDISYYEFLGVNTTTFAGVTYWRDNYAKIELSEILSKIKNDTAGVSNKQLSALGIKQGDKVPNLPLGVSDIDVAVTFDYFPNLVTYEPVDHGDYIDAWSVEFLGHIDYVKSLSNVSESYSTGVYLKLEEDANKTQVDELLAKNFADYDQIMIKSVHDELNTIQDADEFKIILSSFQSMLIITVLISIIAVSYFTFITLSERNKEIGTFRAIGMVKNQIFVLLIVEAMIMLVSGIIFGALTGWFIASNFFYIISNPGVGGIIPPQTLYIPWRLTFGFLGTMFVSTGIAAGFPAIKVASKQTGNVLRAE